MKSHCISSAPLLDYAATRTRKDHGSEIGNGGTGNNGTGDRDVRTGCGNRKGSGIRADADGRADDGVHADTDVGRGGAAGRGGHGAGGLGGGSGELPRVGRAQLLQRAGGADRECLVRARGRAERRRPGVGPARGAPGGPPPLVRGEALRAAFAARGASPEAKVRLGGLLEDLECYVDNCLRFGPDSEIIGRNGGVKAWLREHVPGLSGHYKTLMRYKALAKRLRQAAGISDPVPASAVFDGSPAPPRLPAPFVPSTPLRPPAPAAGREDAPETGDGHGPTGGDVSAGWTEKGRRDAQDYYAVKSQLMVARRIVEGCENTCVALFRAIDAVLD